MKFLIIGGDAAGMSAASRARRNQPQAEVTVLEKTADVSYSACGMPYNIADPARPIDDLVVRQASVFREKQGIRLLTGHEARHIDPAGKTVSGLRGPDQPFRFSYDKLLIATGASPLLPDKPGFDLPGVMVLKSLADGGKIKAFLASRPVKRVVVIGMGYIALEMAEALCARGLQVDMIKPRPEILPWLPGEMAQDVRAEIARHGVNLYPGNEIERIEAVGSGLAVCGPDVTLNGEMVLVAIGIRPNSRIAAEAGLALSVQESIGVDKMLKTSDEHVFAAGDCADAVHVVSGRRVWIPLALRANRAGWAAADNVFGDQQTLQGVAGTAVFKVFDLAVARTGLNAAEARQAGFDPVDIMIESRSRAHAHPGSSSIKVSMVGDRKSGRLLGAQMVGREGVAHRINAPAVALHAQMTVSQFAQSDLAYAPPFGPTWDPLLIAAHQLVKKV